MKSRMVSIPARALLLVAIAVPATACIVNNNQSPGAQGTIAPTVTVDPNVAFAMPGGSAQATAQVSARGNTR
jgi:hypothetical protein